MEPNLEFKNISCERTGAIDTLLHVWETSVRATHHFLSEHDLLKLLPQMRIALEKVPQLIVAQSNKRIIGLMGIDAERLEMLFILPTYFKQGIGRKMLDFALNEYGVKYVDVNEQNSAALQFYKHCQFVIYARSEHDRQANPFPLLHLTRKIVETERLYLREITQSDFSNLCRMLQDDEVMYAWEHLFSDDEVNQWILRNITRYKTDGYGYWLAIDKKSNECVGQIGLILETFLDVKQMGIGWILARRHWGKGYAIEAASACKRYAFNTLHTPCLIADIRPTNISSIHVAEQLGMSVQGQYDKIYKQKIMPHLLYVVDVCD